MDVFRMDAALDEIHSDYLKSRNKKRFNSITGIKPFCSKTILNIK